MAHGSPLDEDEYVASLADAANVFEYLDNPVTFFGHTHLQGGFMWANGRREAVLRPHRTEYETLLHIEPDALYLINPGSTGQPRDSDPRAAYALFDSETAVVLLRRVSYDYDAVRQKIERVGLPPALGQRLAFGR
jgi:diadenosine tetraphosphatase ApaH/serine/threonine PP2A family protein phosphatase